ncbi:hypothetical protein [Allokutzneria sp. NRRL B-24872]|uniref:hypothetical protein n=1 Tax=Allokutzneria sp. NRRL B-24872 TaxID=1137961 RepID=UPI000A3BF205|nr:hypothetical protein [Allokutzneria sp. NRRL B-24872]
MPNLQFAPGEENITEQSFSPSIVLFWLKTRMGVSNTRIATTSSNTLLGVIPLGYGDSMYPLANVAGVSVDTKLSVSRLVFGLVLLAMASAASSAAAVGFVLLVFAVSMLANAMSATLKITNNAGVVSTVAVSILEKAKLERFREQINQRLFADRAALRHDEHMQVQKQQLLAQQQRLESEADQQP